MIVGYVKVRDRAVPLLVDRRLEDGEIRFAHATAKARAAGYRHGFIVMSPTSWGWLAALHLAEAYRPAGLPRIP